MRGLNLRTIGGVLAWIAALFLLPVDSTQAEISLLLLFGVLVMAPLGIELARAPGKESPMYSAAKYLQPFASLVTATSFLVPAGVLAGTLAIAWVPLTGLLAVDAIQRLRVRRIGALEETVIDVGALFLLFGAGWLWVSRLGVTPFGVEEPVKSLVAVHFHFAGFGGTLLAGLAGRHLRVRDGLLSGGLVVPALLILSGPVLVSAGYLSNPAFELIAVVLLVSGYMWLAAIQVFNIRLSLKQPIAGLLLAGSAAAVVLTMALALLFAAGNASRLFYIPIPDLVRYHGWLNALGFVTLGLLGWAVEEEAAKKTLDQKTTGH